MIRYTYFYIYNPKIDWQKKTWKYIRCLDIYTNKIRIRVLDTETDSPEFETNLESVFSKCLLLDEIGIEDHKNPSITLFDHLDEDQKTIAQVITEIFNEKSVEKVLDDNEDISK